MSFVNRIITFVKSKVKRIINGKIDYDNTIDYWEKRTKKYGKRAVLNIANKDKSIGEITDFQINEIFPPLQKHLNGQEQMVLDFGCGIGRFGKHLAELIDGKCVGVDPIQSLLDEAPKTSNTDFLQIVEGRIPLDNNTFDLAWICLVLGGVPDKDLQNVVNEIQRVTKNEGIICLCENTGERKDGGYWFIRNEKFYQNLFTEFNLQTEHVYHDAGSPISVMIGRKKQS